MDTPSDLIGANSNYAADYPYQPQPAAVLELSAHGSSESYFGQPAWRIPWLAMGLCFCFAVCDVAAAPLAWTFRNGDRGAALVYASFGAILAQAGLLACGLVFGSGRFRKRLLWFWAAAVLCFGMWTAGLMIALPMQKQAAAIVVWIRLGVFSAPLAAIAIQSPLWFFRVYRGWRLFRRDREEPERALAIRDYFIGTAIVASSIALARQGVRANWVNEQFWGAWGMVFAIGGILSLVSVIPAMLLMFRWNCVFAVVALIFYAAAVPSGLLALASYFGASRKSPLDWEGVGMTLMFVSLAVFLGLGMKAMREWGFCLVTRRGGGVGVRR